MSVVAKTIILSIVQPMLKLSSTPPFAERSSIQAKNAQLALAFMSPLPCGHRYTFLILMCHRELTATHLMFSK